MSIDELINGTLELTQELDRKGADEQTVASLFIAFTELKKAKERFESGEGIRASRRWALTQQAEGTVTG